MKLYIFCLIPTNRLILTPDKPLLFSKQLLLKKYFFNLLLEEEMGKEDKHVAGYQGEALTSALPLHPFQTLSHYQRVPELLGC